MATTTTAANLTTTEAAADLAALAVARANPAEVTFGRTVATDDNRASRGRTAKRCDVRIRGKRVGAIVSPSGLWSWQADADLAEFLGRDSLAWPSGLYPDGLEDTKDSVRALIAAAQEANARELLDSIA